MSNGPNLNSAKQFILALVVVLGGVVLGSLIVMRKEEPGRTQRPLAPSASAKKAGNKENSWTNDMVLTAPASAPARE